MAVAATICVFSAWLGLRLGGKLLTAEVDDVGETIAALAAAAVCALAGCRQARSRQRLAWAFFALSALSWGAGQAVWTWYEIHLGVAVPFPSLADLGYLSACPTAAAAVLLLPPRRLGARRGTRLLLDGLIIGISLLATSWTLVMRAVYNAGGQSATAQAISLAYPISDVVIGTMLFVTVMRTPRGSRSAVVLVAAALATMALADSSFTYYTATNSYSTGNVLDTGWLAGYLLLGLAALRAYLRPAIASAETVGPSRLMVLLPYVPVVGAGLIDAYSVGVLHSLDLVMLASTSAVVGLVLIRQLVTLTENSELLRKVADRESALQHQANHDALTGLPNRLLLEQRALAALGGSNASCAVLFIDLDDFKRVNDTFGHNTGDRVLMEVAKRIAGLVRDEDTAARLGGDEFAILLAGVTLRTADDVAQRLLAALDRPLVFGDDRLHAAATVGIAVSSGTEPVAWEELMRRADVAMYAAKGRGKCLSVSYSPELDAAADRDSGWHSALDRALGDNQYVLHYQPIVTTSAGTVVAVEALLRWQHPDRGLLPPASFIRDLEESGAMNEVGAWVLD
ncbi:MAG: putative bifunctional diguanylate cyclase/phosphodiesterase, partial [Candidatus Dormibacteria bacterium]